LDEPTSGLDAFSTLLLGKRLEEAAVGCNAAIVMTVHQPSVEFLQHVDEVILVKAGCIYFRGSPQSLKCTVEGTPINNWNSGTGPTSSRRSSSTDRHHLASNYADVAIAALQSSNAGGKGSRRSSLTIHEDYSTVFDSPLPFRCTETTFPPSKKNRPATAPFLQHTAALTARMAMQWRLEYMDVVRVVAAFAIMGSILGLRKAGVAKVMIGITAGMGISVNLLRYKILRMCDYWRTHRDDLQDRIIRRASFFAATQLLPLMFAIPAIIAGLAVYFALLDWPWAAFGRMVTLVVLYYQVCNACFRCWQPRMLSRVYRRAFGQPPAGRPW